VGQATEGSGPTNARYAEVGDCLVKSPTPEFPDPMVIGRCRTRGSYKVVRIEQSAEKDYRTSCG
jgi:hypothetical protein